MSTQRQATTSTGGAIASILLHGAIAALFIWGAWIGKYLPLGGAHPGTAAAGSIRATLVTSVPGGSVPIPNPVTVKTQNRLASDTHAESVTRSQPHAAPRHSIALPSYQPENLARKAAMADLRKLAQADRDRKKDDRVAYGAGGPVSFSSTTSTMGSSGGGGMSFGDANFGNLYTDWVNHLRDRLEFYWSQQPRDPTLPAGTRVTVTMTVHRDGSIDTVRYLQRAASTEVNSMAYNSVTEMAQAEKFPLPQGYAPNALTVSVAFEINGN